LKVAGPPFLYLIHSIMSQQLSTRVAEVIKGRFHVLAGKSKPSAEEVLKLSALDLRSIGLSGAKVQYIHNVAAFAIENELSMHALEQMKDEQVIQHVTQIKGVGRWTAEMLLMFGLGREDVFPADDLGIRQAMCEIYNISFDNIKENKLKMFTIAEKWRPYRTYACLHLWHWKDN
jgi:DNA-3-methyladenine glycosylase II